MIADSSSKRYWIDQRNHPHKENWIKFNIKSSFEMKKFNEWEGVGRNMGTGTKVTLYNFSEDLSGIQYDGQSKPMELSVYKISFEEI